MPINGSEVQGLVVNNDQGDDVEDLPINEWIDMVDKLCCALE